VEEWEGRRKRGQELGSAPRYTFVWGGSGASLWLSLTFRKGRDGKGTAAGGHFAEGGGRKGEENSIMSIAPLIMLPSCSRKKGSNFVHPDKKEMGKGEKGRGEAIVESA